MNLIRLEVSLDMDKKNPPWANMYEFEKSFADFLAAHGIQAEKIEYAEGSSRHLCLMLSPMEIPMEEVKKQTPPGKILKKLQERKHG